MDRLVWIDCEMTGLDLGSDRLLEVACLVTDGELNVLGEGVDVVIGVEDEVLASMAPVVRDMHAASGLTDAVRESRLTLSEAEQQVLGYVLHHVREPGRVPLCGNSIGTDRGFLARDMPKLDGHLHYRMVDVSSVKELARRWYPRVYYSAPAKHGGHRALADIRESVQELRYYRRAIFVAPPGPTTEAARTLAAELLADDEPPAAAESDGAGQVAGQVEEMRSPDPREVAAD